MAKPTSATRAQMSRSAQARWAKQRCEWAQSEAGLHQWRCAKTDTGYWLEIDSHGPILYCPGCGSDVKQEAKE
jgi:hypothetical protein